MSATTLVATVGDNKQIRSVTLHDANGPIDLTNASAVAFHATQVNGTATISKTASFTASTAGSVSVQLNTADLTTTGTYQCEWQVTFADATVTTVPAPVKDVLLITDQKG